MIPPQNMEAEQSVLGSILRDKEVISDVRTILKPSDFYNPSHGQIYETILELHNKGIPVDVVTLADQLAKAESLEQVGGPSYIFSLTEITPTSANAKYYANIVKERSIRRQIIQAANIMSQRAYEDSIDHEDILRDTQQAIFQLSMSTKAEGGLSGIYEPTLNLLDDIENRQEKSGLVGIPTGYSKLDTWTAGLQSGQLIIVAGRPSMGKTSWVIQLGSNAAINYKKRVAIFSLETSRDKLIEKMIVNQGCLKAQNLRFGIVDDPRSLANAANSVAQAPILIDDTANIDVHEIHTRCRKAKLEGGLDMVIIDYLQLIKASNKKGMTRDRELGEISRALKIMAGELKVPVIALSQLSRTVEQTSDKRPTLSHLRESGALEQDADMVAFLYRPEYYFPNEQAHKGVTEIIVAKQREGPIGTVKVVFQKEFTKFIDVEGRVVS